MNNKKAQITIFIIMGIIIIISVGIIFISKSKISQKEGIPNEIVPIYSFVSDCIKQTGENAVNYIGETGGYSNKEKEVFVAFYFYNETSYIISKDRLEEEISNYINENIQGCVNDFSSFAEFLIEVGDMRTNVEIQENSVILNVNYPLQISKDKKTYLLEEFEGVTLPIRLGVVYDLAYEMTQEQVHQKDSVCITCIAELANDRGLNVKMDDYDDYTIIYTITDENSLVNNNPFIFKFAYKLK
jgi:hypothetical protein